MNGEPFENQIELIQQGIEECVKKGMTLSETMATLFALQSYSVPPEMTLHVWNQMEAENPHFFATYNVHCRIKNLIDRYNRMVEFRQDTESRRE